MFTVLTVKKCDGQKLQTENILGMAIDEVHSNVAPRRLFQILHRFASNRHWKVEGKCTLLV